MSCIICIDKNPITDSNPLTKEHAFPEAIGGDHILRKPPCKICNDHLGKHIDIHLTNHPYILVQRQLFSLTGKSGKIPNPFPTFTDSYGRKGNLTSTGFKFHQKSKRLNDEEVIYVPSSNETLEKSIEEVNKILTRDNRHNHSPLSEEKIIELSKVPPTEVLLSASTVANVDQIEYQRALIKIAYELTVDWLDDHYLHDPVAIKIRECLQHTSMDAPGSPNHWANKFCIDGSIEDYNGSMLENIFSPIHPDSHCATLVKTGSHLICFIKIFRTFIGWVCVSKNSEHYPKFSNKYIEIKIPK